MAGAALVVDGGLADLACAVAVAADELVVDDDAAADAGAEGEADEVFHAPAGAAFPFGEGHAVGVVVDGDGEGDLGFEEGFEGDLVPAGDVGELGDDAFFEVDEAGHADADGGDAGVAAAEVLDDADDGGDELAGGVEFLGGDGWGVVDDVSAEDHAGFYGGAAEVDADGQWGVAHAASMGSGSLGIGTTFHGGVAGWARKCRGCGLWA